MLPLHNRVIVHNILTIGWTAYLSKCEQEFESKSESESDVAGQVEVEVDSECGIVNNDNCKDS